MDTIQYGYGLPPDYSTHGAAIDQLIYVLHGFMIFLFVAWGIFLAYCLIKYRKREGHKASYESNKSKLPKYAEVAVVLVEVILLVGLSFPVWSKYKQGNSNAKDSILTRVVGQQFIWNIQYAGEDGKLGRSDPKLMDDNNPLGIDKKDPAAWDDFVSSNQFHIPINQQIISHISSKDVIHSFGVPVLRLKQDAIPGMEVPIWFTATKTGTFDIICSQLCGVGHSLMKGTITVDSAEDFKKWFSEQPKEFKPKTVTEEPAKGADKGKV